MSDTQTILPDTEVLELLHVHASGQSITLVARTTSAEVCCLVYGMLSRSGFGIPPLERTRSPYATLASSILSSSKSAGLLYPRAECSRRVL